MVNLTGREKILYRAFKVQMWELGHGSLNDIDWRFQHGEYERDWARFLQKHRNAPPSPKVVQVVVGPARANMIDLYFLTDEGKVYRLMEDSAFQIQGIRQASRHWAEIFLDDAPWNEPAKDQTL